MTPDAGYKPARCWPQQIVAPGPRFSAERHYLLSITARPRLLSVTESIALPPRPEAVHVKYLQIQCSGVAHAAGPAADLFRAADRRYDADPMVVRFREAARSAQASASFDPMTRSRSSLACKLRIRAADALNTACQMPPGSQRMEAMNKAKILGNAAEMLDHFVGQVGVPGK